MTTKPDPISGKRRRSSSSVSSLVSMDLTTTTTSVNAIQDMHLRPQPQPPAQPQQPFIWSPSTEDFQPTTGGMSPSGMSPSGLWSFNSPEASALPALNADVVDYGAEFDRAFSHFSQNMDMNWSFISGNYNGNNHHKSSNSPVSSPGLSSPLRAGMSGVNHPSHMNVNMNVNSVNNIHQNVQNTPQNIQQHIPHVGPMTEILDAMSPDALTIPIPFVPEPQAGSRTLAQALFKPHHSVVPEALPLLNEREAVAFTDFLGRFMDDPEFIIDPPKAAESGGLVNHKGAGMASSSMANSNLGPGTDIHRFTGTNANSFVAGSDVHSNDHLGSIGMGVNHLDQPRLGDKVQGDNGSIDINVNINANTYTQGNNNGTKKKEPKRRTKKVKIEEKEKEHIQEQQQNIDSRKERTETKKENNEDSEENRDGDSEENENPNEDSEERRQRHISSEKRRRETCRQLVEELCVIVPELQTPTSVGRGRSLSATARRKSNVLALVREYILQLEEENRNLRQYLSQHGYGSDDIEVAS